MKTKNELLDKALDFIVETQESDDYICEKMMSEYDEFEYCANNCQNLNKECVRRFLNHYESKRL